MKLFYDDKKIPFWVEVLAVVVVGIIYGCMFGLSI